MEMRRVTVYSTVQKKEVECVGYFHRWGKEGSHDENNGDYFPVAIVEKDNGEVITRYAGFIKFNDRENNG